MPMQDDSMVKIMETLGLNFNPAETSIKSFEGRITALNKQLFDLKANAIAGAKDINQAFSSQLGGMGTGSTILNQFGQPLKTVQSEAKKAGTSISGMAGAYTSTSTAAKKYGETIQDTAKKFNLASDQWQRRSQWFVSGSLFYGGINAVKETVQTISEVEMGVTEIARVMEDSTFVFKDYRDELLQLGVDYGMTFENVQDIALRWAQAGYNVKDSLENTKTSLLALNTAELDAKNATESMIGIMSQWQLTSKDLPLVLDKINKTADDFTVTSQDLVDGLLRSSGAAKIMGLSLDQTISLLTVMREASGRTGREVGNALNSILSYIQRPKSIDVLESLGIQMFSDKAKTQFRNVMEIFKDIEANWQTSNKSIQDGFVQSADDAGLFSEEMASALGMEKEWNDLQQRDISQAAAGVYRRNYFIGMIERLSGAQNVLNGMTDAAGYSQKENARTMETLEKKYESLKTAAQELAVALGDAGLLDMLKGLTDTTKNAADGFSKLDDGTKTFILTALELIAVAKGFKALGGAFGFDLTLAALWKIPNPAAKAVAAILAIGGALGLIALNSRTTTDESIKDSLDSINAKKNEVAETNNLISKYEELKGQAVQTTEVKTQLHDIEKRLAELYPSSVDGIDKQNQKFTTQIGLVKQLSEAKLADYKQEMELLSAKALVKVPVLQSQYQNLNNEKDNITSKIAGIKEYLNANKDLYNKAKNNEIDDREIYNATSLPIDSFIADYNRKISEWESYADKLKGIESEKAKVDSEWSSYVNAQVELDKLKNPGMYKSLNSNYPTASANSSASDNSGSGGNIGGSGSGSKTNEPLQNALRYLEHMKHLNQISTEEEIAYLNNINALYARNGEERMDIEERIYDAQKTLMDKKLQNSVNWINEKKSLDQLSVEEEIAAWNRVLTNQKNNIEAVKEATQNLYRLQKELRDKTVEETKTSLKDIQDSIKESYDERISLIEKESEEKKKAQQDIIDGIEEEEKALDRKESNHDYSNELDDLKNQLEYWRVRTSEDARQKVADLNAQIAEKEHDHEIDLQKQTLEDKKDAAEDEIDNIEETAKTEKGVLEKSYALIEDAFGTHGTSIVNAAISMSKEAYQAWVDNYVTPLQSALGSGSTKEVESAANSLTASTSNSQIYSLAKSILSYKKQWQDAYESGDSNLMSNASSAASSLYDKLEELSSTVAVQLESMNYETAKAYVDSLPKSHEGSKVLSYGAANLAPGELIFPANLSVGLESLISLLSKKSFQQIQGASSTDNRKEIKIGTLLNIENNNMEDEVDVTMLSRELKRAIISIT